MRPASEDEVMRLSMTMAAQAAGAEEPLALVRSEKGGPWTRAKAEALARASQRIAARGQTPGEPFRSLCRLRGERIWKKDANDCTCAAFFGSCARRLLMLILVRGDRLYVDISAIARSRFSQRLSAGGECALRMAIIHYLAVGIVAAAASLPSLSAPHPHRRRRPSHRRPQRPQRPRQ